MSRIKALSEQRTLTVEENLHLAEKTLPIEVMNIPLPANEESRLRALQAYAILDTTPEAAFERITRLAAQLFHVPIALISLVDRERQWFKSRYGLDADQTDRAASFCAHAILSDEVLVVPDASLDARFAAHPAVTGELGLRFYAGAPLKVRDGFNLGSLCIIDTGPREFTDEQRTALIDLAAIVVDEMELRIAGEKLRVEVAESHRRQEALQAAEARTQQIVEIAHNAFVSMDADGLITGWNGHAEAIFGWPREEAIGRSLAETIIPPSLRQAHWRGLQTFLETEQGPVLNQIFEISAVRRDGSEFPIELSISPLRWGDTYTFTAFVRDITERKATETELQESQRFAQAIADQSTSIIYIIDLETRRHVYSNRDGAAFLGYTPKQVEALDSDFFLGIIHPDDHARAEAHFDEFGPMSDHDTMEFEQRIRDVNGQWHTLLHRERVFRRRPNGTPQEIMGTAIDITARKAAEAELQHEQEFLKVLLESTQEGIVACDADGNLTLFNRATREFHGLPAQGAPAEEWAQQYDLYLADGQTPMQTAEIPLFRALQGEVIRDVEMVIAPRNGAPRSLLANGQAMFDDNGRKLGAVVTMHDITARKAAEAELRAINNELEIRVQRRTDALAQANIRLHESADRLQAILDNTTAIIYLKDLEGRYLLVNRQFQALYNTTREQLIGKTDYDFFPAHMADIYAAHDQEVLATNGVIEREEEAPQPDGIHTYISVKFPLRDADGKTYAVCGISTDITQRKRDEVDLQAAKEEAESANRAKDEFLATVSHELRTPLTAIMGWADLLRSETLERDLLLQGANVILRSTHAQSLLINDLLDVSRIATGKLRINMQPTDLRLHIVAAIDGLLPTAQAKRITLEFQSEDGAYPVMADSDRVQQVAWNLITNALKFTPQGGQVKVQMTRVGTSAEFIVSDTGKGIAPEFLPYIFDRFRQADSSDTRAFGGLGLGLSIVRQLIELHGGTVRVHSEGAGCGATFTVSLPLL